MTYNEHLEEIRVRRNYALVKEEEFENEFSNPNFAQEVLKICLEETNNYRAKYQSNLCFGIRYSPEINASADTKNIIFFNHGLINEMEAIIRDRIQFYNRDSLTSISNVPITEDELFKIFTKVSIAYLFYHELAHIIQNQGVTFNSMFTFSELHVQKQPYDERRHIYEFDADLFGILFGTAFYLGFMIENKHIHNPAIQLHTLTLFIGIVGSLLLSFSGKKCIDVYYKDGRYPSEIIRIFTCVEQILYMFSESTKYSITLKPGSPFTNVVIERAYSMLDLLYEDFSKNKYSKIVKTCFEEMSKYKDEIETLSDSRPELTRHKATEIYNRIAGIE